MIFLRVRSLLPSGVGVDPRRINNQLDCYYATLIIAVFIIDQVMSGEIPSNYVWRDHVIIMKTMNFVLIKLFYFVPFFEGRYLASC